MVVAHPRGTTDVAGAATPGRSLRLSIPWPTWLMIFGGVIAVVAVSALVDRAQRPIGWALAAIVIAAALEPAVSSLDRRIPRTLAVIGVIVAVIAVFGTIAWLTLRDLDDQFEGLKEAIPEAAAEIEASARFGDAARDVDLAERAQDFADDLRSPSQTAGGDAVAGLGASVVVLILTLFMLAWGKRMSAAAAGEIDDPARRERVSRIVGRAFVASQRYINVLAVGAVVVFAVALSVYTALDVPGAAPLALLVAVASTVPVVGLFLGILPAAALHAALGSPWVGALMLTGAVIAQFAHQQTLDHFTRGNVARPGSAVMLISFVLGYDLYGVGGALVGTALVVFAVALIDSVADPGAATPGEP